jgi:hypothetical protein
MQYPTAKNHPILPIKNVRNLRLRMYVINVRESLQRSSFDEIISQNLLSLPKITIYGTYVHVRCEEIYIFPLA